MGKLGDRGGIVKRLFDLFVSLLALMALWPVILLVGLLIRFKLGSPVLFKQTRPGLHGKPFNMLKFRSMLDATDKDGNPLPDEQRLTRFGRILRSTSLDELPQLWNILRGEMSLVGPRPIIDEEIERYGEKFLLYTKVTPGLTGLWQVSGRNNLPYEERVNLDAYYVRNWSVWLDFYILLRTVWVVLWAKGAY